MTRRDAVLAALLAAAPLALAAEEAGWQKRLAAFERTADAERRKLGLDAPARREALYGRYPTPEVTFGEPAVVCPGATAEVRVAGALAEGSLVVPRSDAVQVVKERRTPSGWEAQVKVAPGAPPDQISFEVVTPVSGASASGNPVIVGCRHTWTLEAGGDTLVVTTEFGRDADATATGQWRRAGKVLGETRYRATRGSRSIALAEEQSMEQMQASASGFQDVMGSKAWKDLDARTAATAKKLEACGKVPPAQMQGCFAAPQKELEAIAKERDALLAAAERKGAPAYGCRNLDVVAVEGGAPGAVEGDADQCAGRRNQERLPVTGRFTTP